MNHTQHVAPVHPVRTDAEPEFIIERIGDRLVWRTPESKIPKSIQWGYVLPTWLMCVAASLVLAALFGTVAGLTGLMDGNDPNSGGFPIIIAAFATFIGFVGVQIWRVVHVEHNRLLNSLAVAGVHIGFVALLIAAQVIARSVFDWTPPNFADGHGGWRGELGVMFYVLERSAATAIIASLLAPAILPALGPRPDGTQTAPVDTDHQL